MRIALIEDNTSLAAGIANRLRDSGHAVDHIADGTEALQFLTSERADIVVLDINLPGQSGLQILRALRQQGDMTPVILLTARTTLDDRVAGLDAGADDYLVKPFEYEELEARIRALARRRPELAPETTRLGTLEFSHAARVLCGPGGPLALPRRELAVLECLLDNQDRIVAKQKLLDHVYGVGTDTDETVVEVYVSRLRKRLAPFGVAIRTARGIGYMLTEDEA